MGHSIWEVSSDYERLQSWALDCRENANKAKQIAKKTFKRERERLAFIKRQLKTNKQLGKALKAAYKVEVCVYRWSIKGYLDAVKHWRKRQMETEKRIKEFVANGAYLKSLEQA